MAKIEEKINEIIRKIDGNISTGLKDTETENFLEGIEGDLKGLKEIAEVNQKEIVGKKARGLLVNINETLAKEEISWVKSQDVLIKIKNGLNELKSEIKALKGESQGQKSTSLFDFGSKLTGHGIDIAKTGAEMGGSVMPLFGTAVGAIAGAGVGVGYGIAGITGFFAEKSINELATASENFRKGLQDTYTGTVQSGENVFNKWIDGWVGVISNLTNKIAEVQLAKVKAEENITNAKTEAERDKAKADLAKAEAELVKMQADRTKAEAELAKIRAEANKVQAQVEVSK